jgi:hypothetical protein
VKIIYKILNYNSIIVILQKKWVLVLLIYQGLRARPLSSPYPMMLQSLSSGHDIYISCIHVVGSRKEKCWRVTEQNLYQLYLKKISWICHAVLPLTSQWAELSHLFILTKKGSGKCKFAAGQPNTNVNSNMAKQKRQTDMGQNQ